MTVILIVVAVVGLALFVGFRKSSNYVKESQLLVGKASFKPEVPRSRQP